MILTLQETKLHLRIQQDDEDAYLTSLIKQAEAAALDFCALDAFLAPTPEPVRLAVLLMASHYYEFRDSSDKQSLIAMRMSFESLLRPYKNITF